MSHRKSGDPYSDFLEIASGDGGNLTALSLRDEESFEVEYIKIEYNAAATVTATLEFFDEPDGSASSDLSDKLDQFDLQAGDRIIIEEPTYKEVEDDVIATTGGSQDAAIAVTIGGSRVSG